jgi:hypothetical protein
VHLIASAHGPFVFQSRCGDRHREAPRWLGPGSLSPDRTEWCALEPVSGQVGLCFPGRVILGAETGNNVRGGTVRESRD